MRQSRPACPHVDLPLKTDASLGRKLLTATQHAWTCYWLHRAARATAGVLHTLDDRALKDIGLDRSEVESVAYGSCGRSGERAGDRAAERRARVCYY